MASIFDEIICRTTQGDAWALLIPNVKGQGSNKSIASRDPQRLEKYAKKNDRQEMAREIFYCVATIEAGKDRKKKFALQLPFVHAEIDFKDHPDKTPAEIESIIRNLECPPTRIHGSGNGLHCLWKLNTPVDLRREMDRTEALLRNICNLLGGDPSVAHCVALLRCPSTHNSKRGEWKMVQVLKEGTETYTLDQLEHFATREPLLVRRGNVVRETNPFLRAAEAQGFRAPVNVGERLDAMRVGGEGDSGVHQTQLSCTASLMAAGVDAEEAVAMVLEATQALVGTRDWNWKEEEKNLHIMCADYEKKFGPRKPNSLSASVVSLHDATKSRGEEMDEPAGPGHNSKHMPKLKKQKNEHVVLGMGIQAWLSDNGRQIMYADEQCWMYRDGVWKAMGVEEERNWINRKVDDGCNAISLVSTTKIVNETRAWLQRQSNMAVENVSWDDHGLIATVNGLLDWEDGTIEPLAPEDYATRLIDCKYDPAAICTLWEAMLKEDYGFDEGTISFLQEFTGVCLILKKPRGLMRALVLLGPSNTGKSNILNVIAGLVSKETNPTPLQMIEGTHGLVEFLKPNPWVLHEAFEQSRWEMSATVKAILSGDPVQANVKNGPLIPVNFRQPVLWGTNTPPQFKEASRAMENRLAIVRMKRVYNPMRVTGTAALALQQGFNTPAELVLATEKPGLLNWAIAGLKRALDRGHFVFTDEMMAALHAMRTDSNMALGFIEECAEYDPNSYVNTPDFYGAFSVWWKDHKGGQVPSSEGLGRAMLSLSDPRVLVGEKINQKRVYAGLRLNEEGLDCWSAYSSSLRSRESGQRIAERDSDVNRLLTPVQLQRGEFAAMQDAHRTWVSE